MARHKTRNPRRRTFPIRLSVEERSLLQEKADSCHLPLGTFVRRCALDRHINAAKTVPELNRQAWVDLGKVGSNLNQLTRILHSDPRLAITPARARQLEALLRSTEGLLQDVRGFLLGQTESLEDDIDTEECSV